MLLSIKYFLLIGVIVVIRKKTRGSIVNNTPFSYLIIIFLSVLFFIPMDWDRYYLPVILVMALIEGRGMEFIINRTYLTLIENIKI